jgi:phosphoglycolate phosphatase-like HAD superfamily hydrolase
MKKIVLGLAAAMLATSPAHALQLFGIDETNNLISFDSSAPGATLSSVAISGVGGSSILAMDLRRSNNVLYALTDAFGLYTLNPVTGVATLVNNLAITGSNFAMDFNPVVDRLRIVSNNNTNYVFNPATNALVTGTNVAYGAGDANVGKDPDIVSAAYLNNDNSGATGTTLFVLDSRNDVLATQNAATGVLTTIGATGVDLGARTSFDIATVGSLNSAFATSGNRLFSVNFGTGAFTSLGNTDRALFALTAGPVPEPATWGLMILGFGVVGSALRSRGRRQSAKVSFA